jgi:hypothetical protein
VAGSRVSSPHEPDRWQWVTRWAMSGAQSASDPSERSRYRRASWIPRASDGADEQAEEPHSNQHVADKEESLSVAAPCLSQKEATGDRCEKPADGVGHPRGLGGVLHGLVHLGRVLVGRFPTRFGRVIRCLYSPPDWEPAPRRIPVSGRYVKVGSFPRDDTHLITLTTSYGNVLRVLVVPPGLSAGQGTEALLASATPGNASTAVALLGTVTEFPDVDPADQWSDDGGSWWDPHPMAPSVRTGG